MTGGGASGALILRPSGAKRRPSFSKSAEMFTHWLCDKPIFSAVSLILRVPYMLP